jgi:hypothetical protein
MWGSTNRSSCEATMASPSAPTAMSFIVIHRILMNKKKQQNLLFWYCYDSFCVLDPIMKGDLYTDQLEVYTFRCPFWREARVAVQSERATRSEAPLSTSKNRLALACPAAAYIRGKRRGETVIHFASLAARGVLAMCVHGLRIIVMGL